jgi:hypothetical protein
MRDANDDTPLYFVDGTHPCFTAHAAYGWIRNSETRELKSNHGRQNVNINGALRWPGRDFVHRQTGWITSADPRLRRGEDDPAVRRFGGKAPDGGPDPGDGHDKQDCESVPPGAGWRRNGGRYRRLRPVYLGDDLFSRQPVCEAVLQTGDISSSSANLVRIRRSESFAPVSTLSRQAKGSAAASNGLRTHTNG